MDTVLEQPLIAAEPIRFFVPGEPKAQPRPRAFARKMGEKFVARVYDAGTAEGWKSAVAVAAKPYLPAVPLSGPLRIDIAFLFPRPQRLMKKSSPACRIAHVSKPDRDNLDKAVLDALKVLRMFEDDSQVCCGEVSKWYISAWEQPGAQIEVRAL